MNLKLVAEGIGMRRLGIALRATVCGSLTLLGIFLVRDHAQASDNVTLITDFGFNGRHAYFFVAVEKGYYKDADLE
jgi:ABC-type nitrate/sulfonate/bicarbonate transport system substrate-binding protein